MKQIKKKPEFSKCWLAACITVSIVFTAASYILSFFDKQPLETLSSAIIETIWGASGVSFIGYAAQNCVRAYTATKLNVRLDDECSHNPEIRNKEGDDNGTK